MVDNAVKNIVQGDNKFDYNSVRSKYFESCSNAYKKRVPGNGPWSIKERERIIGCIKNNDVGVKSSMNDFNDVTKYQIVMENGEEKLVLTGSAIEVLPYEESFDIFLDAHNATYHGDFAAVKAALAHRFLVYDSCLEIFLLNCNVCQSKRIGKILTSFNSNVLIEIRKMPIEDNGCKYILFYMDRGTKLKLLIKPLMSSDEHDVSIELFKIFSDFGPPLTIQTKHTLLLKKVLSTLGRGGLRYNIPIHEINTPMTESALIDNILSQNQPRGANWTTISRLVQHEHNTIGTPCKELHRLLTPPMLVNKLLSNNQNECKTSAEKKLSFEESSSTEKIIHFESDEEEINESMDAIDKNIEYCPSPEPGPSNVSQKILNFDETVVKEEITVGETVIMDTSKKTYKANTTHIKSVPTQVSTKISKDNSLDIPKVATGKENKLCSYCNGRMFTDYFCFGCKKPTHIFCLKRVEHTGNRETGNIVTFLFCRSCQK